MLFIDAFYKRKLVPIRIATLLLLLSFAAGYTCDFSNGVHVINEDTISYDFHFYTSGLGSTRICWISNPTEGTKNGIAPLIYRSNNGLISHQEEFRQRMTGTFQPQSEICCFTATGTTITIEGFGEVTIRNNSTLLFRDAKLWVIAKDGSINEVKISN